MPWHYKPPQNFPAYYGETIKRSLDEGEPVILEHHESKLEAEIGAEQIRYYKYCVRNTPAHELKDILQNYDVRTSIKDDGLIYILWLNVRPTKISDFITNNPTLAKEILAQV